MMERFVESISEQGMVCFFEQPVSEPISEPVVVCLFEEPISEQAMIPEQALDRGMVCRFEQAAA